MSLAYTMKNMWMQFYSIYTLGLQKNILGKECEIGEILKFKKNTITQNKGKLVFNEYVVSARCFVYIISPTPHKTSWNEDCYPSFTHKAMRVQKGCYLQEVTVCQS